MEFSTERVTDHRLLGEFKRLNADRSEFQVYFQSLLAADQRLKGLILDVGAGPGYPTPEPIRRILEQASHHHGLDPDERVLDHPGLEKSWVGTLEQCEVPPETYDAVFTYNVVEHVENPEHFLTSAYSCLKQGGVMYGLTPHSRHPFSWLSRTIELLQQKTTFRKHVAPQTNDYPAYYRMNSHKALAKPARAVGFRSLSSYFVPCVQWDQYFPRALRFFPNAYDRMIGARFPSACLIYVFKLEK